ncbi:MAG: glycerophosphodiester phosphodiesterase [Chloroflexi bacterium]|nr:glycerophosphodiester phosphodiesterase [Chloroflexota bacterium]
MDRHTPIHTPRTLRLAHRGDHRHAPENTLAAFEAAMRVPACDGLEFDVQLSRDGVPIVLHDETLERVQGVAGAAVDLTAGELGRHGVPTLEAVLAVAPRRMFLDVELKVPIGRPVVEVLAAGRGPHLADAVVSSFDPEALRRLHGLAPQWSIWLNAEDLAPATIALAADLACAGISAEWRAIDEPAVTRVARAGLALAAWTVTRRPTYARLVELGVVAICAEGPALDG